MKLLSFNCADRCDATCSFCAREWWAWLRARESQMAEPMQDKLQLRNLPGSKDYYLKRGCSVPWSAAAVTSVRSLKGATVLYTPHPEWGLFEAVHDSGCVGGDGQHWVGLKNSDGWHFHAPREMVKVVG